MRPRWAAVSLVAGLTAGALLSDVIWSALLAYGVTHLIYYYLLRLDPRDASAVPRGAFDRIRVQVGRGDIRVVDETRAGVIGAGGVRLELHTGRGTVQRSP